MILMQSALCREKYARLTDTGHVYIHTYYNYVVRKIFKITLTKYNTDIRPEVYPVILFCL